MLRKVSGEVYEAPPGARIQIVVESQNNNGVNDARFEYANRTLDRETILGLPGCSFTVADDREGFQVGVVFDPAAPTSAVYNLFEVENGGKSDLRKAAKNNGDPLVGFTIAPVPVADDASRELIVPSARRAPKAAATKRPAKKKGGRRADAPKKTQKKKGGRRAKKSAAPDRRTQKASRAKASKTNASRRKGSAGRGATKRKASSQGKARSTKRAQSSTKRSASRKR